MKDKQGIELMVGDKVAIIDQISYQLSIDTITFVSEERVKLLHRFDRYMSEDLLLIPTVEEDTPLPSPSWTYMCNHCGKKHKMEESWKNCSFGNHCHKVEVTK